MQTTTKETLKSIPGQEVRLLDLRGTAILNIHKSVHDTPGEPLDSALFSQLLDRLSISFVSILSTMLLDAVPYLSKLDPASLVGLLVVFLLPFLLSSFRKSPFLLINGKRPFEFKYTKARLRFLGNGQNLVEAGLKKVRTHFQCDYRGYGALKLVRIYGG